MMIIKNLLTVDNIKKEDFFSKTKNDYRSNKEIERIKEIIKFSNIKTGEELTQLYLKSDVFYLHLCSRSL